MRDAGKKAAGKQSRRRLSEVRGRVGRTSWTRLSSMDDSDILGARAGDPSCRPLTDSELRELMPAGPARLLRSKKR